MSVGLIARDAAKLEELANVLGEEGITAEYAAADIRDSDALGAAIKPNPERAGVGVSFAGELAYARMLHEEPAKKGVHVGHTAIAGRIVPGGDHEPDDVAEALWRHHADHVEFRLRLGFD
jgi:hypothetical protein